ncbi:MAG: YihY/virulence factor BrkB family protein [Paracoccaceae bacterium]|nr:YihY/virulence factor BrkB family protein [Paracoccaceae bacterium]
MPDKKSLLVRAHGLWTRISTTELGLIAAGIAFFSFLAVFPAMAAVIAIWGFASDPGVIREQMERLADFLPPEAYALLYTQVQALLAANDSRLGWATVFSTLLAIWSARAGVAALIRGLNAIYGLPGRGGALHLLRALVLTFVLVGLALCALVLAVVTPLVLGFLPLGPAQAAALELVNFGLGLLLIVVAIAIVYQLGPNHRAGRRPPLVTRGLLIAVVLWAVASRGLVFYLANFGAYNQVYGSIGAVVALLLWFYLSAYAVLLGGAVDAERGPRLQ